MSRPRRQSAPHSAVAYAASPLLASRTPAWRTLFVVGCIGVAFAGLVTRAVYIQAVNPEFFIKQGENRYARTLELQANRGRILDRNGLILASSVPVPSLWANPKEMQLSAADRKQLAKLLQMPEPDLAKRLTDRMGTPAAPGYVWLKRHMDEAAADAIKALKFKGIYQTTEFMRRYPEGESAAHVVGFTSQEDQGLEGAELSFQQELLGKDGSRRVIKDRLGRVVEDLGEAAPAQHGKDIELSLDSKVQFFAFQKIRDAVAQHNANAGSVVVLDAQTGEVLALANWPSYTPDSRQRRSGEQLRNRAVTDIFEPGSTMKPFVVAWALETGRVKPETVIPTAPGRITITGSTITDAHAHGDLTVEQVIQKSSNVGTVRLAMDMSGKELWELYRNIGIGQKPQIKFPGVAVGRLRHYKSWRPIEQATMSYGYGLSASLLQLCRAYTMFARDGEIIPITMLKRHEPVMGGQRIVSPETAAQVRHMLQMAAGEGGTGPLAQTQGFSVGGKSGTAHKQEGKGYAEKKYRSWFVGMAPINKPRIIVGVMVDEPKNGQYYGGLVAAPVFSEVVQQTLRMMGVPPDIAVKPQIMAAKNVQAVEESF